MTDTELLREFVEDRSPAAFAELVNRHAPWVYAVARRRLSDAHLADDVVQSVFLVLATKAHRLRRTVVLSAWLFEVTRMTILRLQRDEIRRRRRETQAVMQFRADEHQPTWRELEPILDESVARLRQRDRTAVLLRFYERKSFAEVGAAMGATEEAARKCVNRAVDRLRAMLAAHVSVVPTSALASLLWEGAAKSEASISAANLARTILAEQARLSIVQLAKGAIVMMAWQKARIAMLSAAAMFFIGTIGVAIFHRPAAHAQPSPSTAPAAALKFIQAAPIFPVRNLAQSVEFYTTKLGFKQEWDYGDPVALVCIGRDQQCIYLSQAGEGAPRSSVYVQVSDVNTMLRDISANGVLPIEGPVDRAWGMREMIVEDPDGHRLRIGSIYDVSALPSGKQK